jgi:hypothetical protein
MRLEGKALEKLATTEVQLPIKPRAELEKA